MQTCKRHAAIHHPSSTFYRHLNVQRHTRRYNTPHAMQHAQQACPRATSPTTATTESAGWASARVAHASGCLNSAVAWAAHSVVVHEMRLDVDPKFLAKLQCVRLPACVRARVCAHACVCVHTCVRARACMRLLMCVPACGAVRVQLRETVRAPYACLCACANADVCVRVVVRVYVYGVG